jgi:hypothetical protein
VAASEHGCGLVLVASRNDVRGLASRTMRQGLPARSVYACDFAFELEGQVADAFGPHPADSNSLYGETVIVATLLTILPMVAVTVTVPPAVMPGTIETMPADTVARFVLLDVQVATSVTGNDPVHVVACAAMETLGSLVVTVPLVGSRVID